MTTQIATAGRQTRVAVVRCISHLRSLRRFLPWRCPGCCLGWGRWFRGVWTKGRRRSRAWWANRRDRSLPARSRGGEAMRARCGPPTRHRPMRTTFARGDTAAVRSPGVGGGPAGGSRRRASPGRTARQAGSGSRAARRPCGEVASPSGMFRPRGRCSPPGQHRATRHHPTLSPPTRRSPTPPSIRGHPLRHWLTRRRTAARSLGAGENRRRPPSPWGGIRHAGGCPGGRWARGRWARGR